jgi:hypothetical protein
MSWSLSSRFPPAHVRDESSLSTDAPMHNHHRPCILPKQNGRGKQRSRLSPTGSSPRGPSAVHASSPRSGRPAGPHAPHASAPTPFARRKSFTKSFDELVLRRIASLLLCRSLCRPPEGTVQLLVEGPLAILHSSRRGRVQLLLPVADRRRRAPRLQMFCRPADPAMGTGPSS